MHAENKPFDLEELNLVRIMESLPDAILVVNTDSQVMYVNRKFCEEFGYHADEARNLVLEDFVPMDLRRKHAGHVNRFLGRAAQRPMGGASALHALRKDGSQFAVDISLSPVASEQYGMLIVASIRNVEDKERLLKDIEASKQEALDSLAAKSEFLAKMSHEIRTPLNAIIGMGDLLSETELTELQQRYVSVSRLAGMSLLGIINDILDISKLESGQMIVSPTVFDLRVLVDDVMALHRPQAEAKGLAFSSSVADEVSAGVYGDAGFLRQILTNLMSNALKFTDAGEVEVRVACEDAGSDVVVLEVRDTGCGIEPSVLGSVFDLFTQVGRSDRPHAGGTGVGLSIVHQLVGLMGGDVRVSSQPGEGTTFSASIPLPAGELPAADAGQEDAESGGDGVSRRILLAEDSDDNRLVFEKYFEGSGHQVTIVENGREAVEAFKAGDFDLVLLDLMMPELDGYGALARIRAHENTRESGGGAVPIWAVTAFTRDDEVRACLEAGFNGHLGKPIRKAELLRAVSGGRMAEARGASDGVRGAGAGAEVLVDGELREVVPGYLAKRRREVSALREWYAVSDFESIRVCAHKLKGHGGSYGFAELSRIGAEMEVAAKGEDAGRVLELIDGYGVYLADVVVRYE